MNLREITWLAGILSAILLSIQVLLTTKVTLYSSNDWGLLTKLPLTFWIGLSILCILLFLYYKFGTKTAIVVILISFYLFAMPVLVHENKAEGLGISYAFAAEGTSLLSEGHLDLAALDMWDLRNWPGFYLATAVISSVSGLNATALADYFPLLTMTLLGLIIYSILRLKFNVTFSSLGALWFIASFWTGQHYYAPQSFAYLMYFALFLITAKLFYLKGKNTSWYAFIILLFVTAVITHLLTSFFILISILLLYVVQRTFRKRISFPSLLFINIILAFILIFFVYQTIFIPNTFSNIAAVLWEQISSENTHLGALTQGRALGSFPLRMQVAGTYSITFINVAIAFVAILATLVGVLLKKKSWSLDAFWVPWIVTAGLLGVSIWYGGEALNRALMFMLIPVTYFAIKILSKKPKILILIVIILVALYYPARYSALNHTYAPATELTGVSFYTNHAPNNASMLYEYLVPVGPPFGAEVSGEKISLVRAFGFYSLPRTNDIDYLISQSQYIIRSTELTNFYSYYFGVDFIQNVTSEKHYGLIYDSGEFKVFNNKIGLNR